MSKNISAHKDRKRINDTVDERQVWVDVFGYSDFESLTYLLTTEQRSTFPPKTRRTSFTKEPDVILDEFI